MVRSKRILQRFGRAVLAALESPSPSPWMWMGFPHYRYMEDRIVR